MTIALLCDIGSTFTKAVAADYQQAIILAVGKAPTTIESDVSNGLRQAITQLEKQIGPVLDRAKIKLACSSAGGGLRMIAIGLVPNLTAKAAKWAALGAGAKLLQTFSFKLTRREMLIIDELSVDIILLAGGIDGGNSDTILHNARLLAQSPLTAPVIVAGNKVVQDEVAEILRRAGKDTRVTDNVMPQLEVIDIEPARQVIRALFLEKIIAAKGLDRIEKFIDGVITPTPSAVMDAAQLLAQGNDRGKGWGEMIVVDVGGATTDLYSMASGEPTTSGIIRKGLIDPWEKRTVEGDLGMRYSASSLFAAVEGSTLLRIGNELDKNSRLTLDELERFVRVISQESDRVCVSERERFLESVIGRAAVETAVQRHVGKLDQIFTPHGKVIVQYGKNLTGVRKIIGTGGILVHHGSPRYILEGAIKHSSLSDLLIPAQANFFLDKKYIMAAAGLLAGQNPQAAFKLLDRYITKI